MHTRIKFTECERQNSLIQAINLDQDIQTKHFFFEAKTDTKMLTLWKSGQFKKVSSFLSDFSLNYSLWCTLQTLTTREVFH